MSNFNTRIVELLIELTNSAGSASMFGAAAAAAAANPAMQGDPIYNKDNAMPVAPTDLILGKKTKRGKKSKAKAPVQRRTLSSL